MQSINTLLDPVVNFGKVTVSTGYSDLDTVIVLNAGHGSKLPNPTIDNPFNLIWYDSSSYSDPSDDPNVEIVRCTDNTSDVLTVERGQEGTLSSSKNTSTNTYKMILSPTKKTISDIKTEYESGINTHASITSNVHGFDSSGNAPAQVHGVSKHTGTIGDHANLTSIGTKTHTAIDTAIDTTLPGLVTTHAGLTTTHGVTSAIVGVDDSQTLTNKNIYDSASFVIAQGLRSDSGIIYTTSPAPSVGQVLTATDPNTATWQYITVGIIPTGGILPYAGATAPSGFLLCDGSSVSRTTYAPLFSIIGTTYGIGDGSTTFNVPNFLGRVIVGAGSGSGLTARTRGDKAGEETHVLTVAELAAHTHLYYSGSSGIGGFPHNSNDSSQISNVTSSTGSNVAHNNMQPFGVANYIIKT